MAVRPKPVRVYFEAGKTKVFAGALEWPGWGRFAKDEEHALAALADYVPRYAAVTAQAGVELPAAAGEAFTVVERLPGSGATDFGAPGKIPEHDREPVRRKDAERLAALVAAAWTVFGRGAASAPAELRKGPRGGGRDRGKMIEHVVQAEFAYARKVGVKHRPAAFDDTAAISALRADLLAVLREPSQPAPPESKSWPTPYAARRIAWHVLDHLWEMEDRAKPA